LKNYYLDLFDDIAGRYDDDGIASLDEYDQAIYTIWWFESEVNNGGFHQYFTNSTGSDFPIALRSLKKIGAKKTIDMVERFVKIVFKDSVPLDREERNDIIEALEDDEIIEDKLDAINLEFYQSDEDIVSLINKFIETKYNKTN